MSRRGKALEVRLGARHMAYLESGTARVHKTHPEAHNIKGKIVYSSKGPPDYIGTLSPHGTSVVFDAKESRSSAAFRLDLVKPHQARDLEACDRMGGIAFIVARTTAGEWALRWRDIAEGYWSKSVSRMLPSDMDTMGSRIENSDWLPAAREWEAL